jgi:signal transduction histidine kinase
MSGQKTIVLIDDDQKFSFGLAAVLRRAGFHVLTAFNGVDGEKLIRMEKPDLILCDIMMPPPNGLQLKRELENDPQAGAIPFLFLTARTGQSDKIASLAIGADDYITKPFDVNELLARIEAVLRRNKLAYQRGVEDTTIAMEKLREGIKANFSHELRTPLTILLMSLDLVIREKFVEDNEELANYIHIANLSAFRLKFLIEDLEMLNAIDQNTINTVPQVVDLRFHLKNPVCEVLDKWAKKSLQIDWVIDPETIIHAPKNEFAHAVAHLVDNACKFSPEHGIVQISVKPNSIGGCIIEVSDQGIGIPVQYREKVFERYFQISQGITREYEGLGIGLTIARAIAQSQNGSLQILDSPPGCRVRMVLPPHELN